MTPAVTSGLLHDLVARSHAEAITALGVEAVIEHHDRVLLIAEPGPDFTDDTWQLPGGPVLPGQTLTGALDPAVAAIGLTIGEITGYLGHHDHPGARVTTRVFRFAVTVTDPGAICRHAGTGHHWAEDLDSLPPSAASLPATVKTPAGEPPLADLLRAWARGIYPDEAGVELLVGHDVFLDRTDFTSRFISIPGDGAGLAVIDWPAAIAALDDSLPCSGSENRMLRLAASLAGGIPISLRDALTGIDDRGIQLVINAVLHASGHRPPSGFHDHF